MNRLKLWIAAFLCSKIGKAIAKIGKAKSRNQKSDFNFLLLAFCFPFSSFTVNQISIFCFQLSNFYFLLFLLSSPLPLTPLLLALLLPAPRSLLLPLSRLLNSQFEIRNPQFSPLLPLTP
jgi:hypothetical protein